MFRVWSCRCLGLRLRQNDVFCSDGVLSRVLGGVLRVAVRFSIWVAVGFRGLGAASLGFWGLRLRVP